MKLLLFAASGGLTERTIIITDDTSILTACSAFAASAPGFLGHALHLHRQRTGLSSAQQRALLGLHNASTDALWTRPCLTPSTLTPISSASSPTSSRPPLIAPSTPPIWPPSCALPRTHSDQLPLTQQ